MNPANTVDSRIIDGKALSAAMRLEMAERVKELKKAGIHPGLAVVLVGEDPASISYVTGKERACAEVGVRSLMHRLPADTGQKALLKLLEELNADPEVHGILVQLPLPRNIDESEVLRAVAPEKDVDGFHPENVGKMMLGEETFLPCTPHGIIVMLERAGVDTRGKHAVVVGRSNIVGKPIANLLLQKNPRADATVTVCHTGTKDIAAFTKMADILIIAAGGPGTVTGDMVKQGAVVIDVGVNRIPDPSKKSGFRLVGDADFDSVLPKVSKITPVPGGVGPMTITMLLVNTLRAAETQA